MSEAGSEIPVGFSQKNREEDMTSRGSYNFHCRPDGSILNNDANLEKLRKLFLDTTIINNALGPGDPGDFDFGAWHVLCHLAGASAVLRSVYGPLLLVEISHVPSVDMYFASITILTQSETVCTFPLRSDEGKMLLRKAVLLGFIEGTSLGHISARDVADPPDRFNKWQRQNFDNDARSKKDGGRVWEHWCTVRDIRPGNVIGMSVLRSYLDMISLCGGALVATVARGRRKYDHPKHLLAMVKAGLIAESDALLPTVPKKIPKNLEYLLCAASPAVSICVANQLEWSQQGLSYYMYSRKIKEWSTLEKVKKDIAGAKSPAVRKRAS